jgi:septal ring factor EnvC (AmiA/AmiB activator)
MRSLNPLPNGTMSTPFFSKSVELSSYNSDTIISPNDGIVVSSDKNKCGGNIKIEHLIDGNSYYSKFCNVGNIYSVRGNQVSRGERIGTVGDSPIEYTVTNSNGDKMDVRDFLSGNITSPKSQDKEIEKEKSKEIKKEKEKSKEREKERNKNEIDSTPMTNPFMDLLLSPVTITGKVFKSMKGKSIKEEVDRIKQIIKH